MALAEGRRSLIVTADDFGQSSSINAAVIHAHREGILTCASLMPAGAAFDQAVELAKANPGLGVGLHLTLCCGRPVLPASHIPDLVNDEGAFHDCPAVAGLKYFFSPAAREQLEREITAQFAKFAATGLLLDHVNGHLHFHLHPAVLRIVLRIGSRYGCRAIRLTREPWEVDFLQERGRWAYRLTHAAIFELLTRRSASALRKAGFFVTDQVFGLLQNGHVTEDYLLRLLPELPKGVSEVYSHPALESARELQALTSKRVLELVQKDRLQLIRYQDLWSNC